jgi:hypothetical protein
MMKLEHSEEARRPRVGDLVQIWDSMSNGDDDKIKDHGMLGVVTAMSKKTDTFVSEDGKTRHLTHINEGDCYVVLVSRDTGPDKVHVNYNWLRPIKNKTI